MAIQSLHFTIIDGNGDTSTISYNIDSGVSVANATLIATALEGMLLDIIDGDVIGVSLSRAISTGVADFAGTLSDVEEKARFIFRAVGSTKPVIQSIPTFLESLFTSAKKVDLADPDVDTYVDAMVNGITLSSVVYPFLDSESREIEFLKDTAEAYTRRRR